jgi:glucosamine--fructose-6-phosphate aminotransferase (isomerizing)
MCGIIGILGRNSVSQRLLEGLKRLEYRGYDSAGIATLDNQIIHRRRASGKLVNLEALVEREPLEGNVGIGHTRWATHGPASVENAHPHASDHVVLVHNGIIENYHALKKELMEKGIHFESETDSEVVVHLITYFCSQGLGPLEAIQKAVAQLQGAFALVILFKDHPHQIFGVRRGSPLVFGKSADELFFGSDVLALSNWVDHVIYLEEGDIIQGENSQNHISFRVYNQEGDTVHRELKPSSVNESKIGKGVFSHFMLKEIFEQPQVMADTLHSLVYEDEGLARFRLPLLDWSSIERIRIIACGTSFYAGFLSKYWFEDLARLNTECEIASEFRYRNPILEGKTLNIFVSQSGETIDTLAALNLVQSSGAPSLAIVNVIESSIARVADHAIQTIAGPEIGVASTKAFTAQLLVLAILALKTAKNRETLSPQKLQDFIQSLYTLPRLFQGMLAHDEKYRFMAQNLTEAQSVLFLGRGTNYPLALEGALKLKELSYIHAEGYPAGELKHGPIALIDKGTPVVLLMPYDAWFEKTYSNMEQVMARGAQVLVITDEKGDAFITKNASQKNIQRVVCPGGNILLNPLLYAIPIQLLAYYTALLKGTDVDQPRNLAKSVTVE